MGKKSKVQRDRAEIEKEQAVKFKRVVEPRVVKAVRALRLVGNCAGAGYNYTIEQKAQVLDVVGNAFKDMLSKFERSEKAQSTFKLDS